MSVPKSPPLVPSRLSATPVRTVESIADQYELGAVLGEGKFGKVVQGVHKETGKVRAIKVVKTESLDERASEGLAHEREILRRVKHANIIELHEVVVTGTEICLTMEKLDYDLYEYIKQFKQPMKGLPETDARSITSQLLSAVGHLHDNGIVHRDIKPENILLNNPGEVRLADFGLAKVATTTSTPVGTSYYMAPEIVRAIEILGHTAKRATSIDEVKYVDMWSSGCVLYILLSGRPPFLGGVSDRAKRMNLLRQINRGVMFPTERWSGTSVSAQSLVRSLLDQEITDRLTVRQALNHDWFKIDGEPTSQGESSPDAVVTPDETEDPTKAEVSEHLTTMQNEVARELGELDMDGTMPSINIPALSTRKPIKLPPKPSPKMVRPRPVAAPDAAASGK
eukprot:TRINITY_DN949_c0_g2_i1.p1 TRINITY_DN949_c0_g2~~TRINITY_DN949_c0_g2_i1.p1  ORF type:complete len:413 (+),score=70.57 TRINITY_DN949_c0_g2_i1:53-1240(+)